MVLLSITYRDAWREGQNCNNCRPSKATPLIPSDQQPQLVRLRCCGQMGCAMLILLVALASSISHSIAAVHPVPVGFLNHTAVGMFKEAEQSHIQQIVAGFMINAREQARIPQLRPSVQSPFIFFHQRKAAGSSLRTSLHEAADRMNVSHYMPCKDNVSCDTYTFPMNARFAVNAGHFPWSETNKLARHNKYAGLQRRHNFTCLTNFREPVSRLISYFQFYFPEVFRKRCFSNLTEEELHSLLVDDVDSYGFSPLNEPFRILSGVNDEDLLGQAGFVEVGGVITPRFTRGDAAMLEDTLRNVARCSNLLVEVDNDTTTHMLQTRLPDLYDAGAFHRRTENELKDKAECGPPRADQVSMLESVSALEGVVYHAVHEFVTSTFGKRSIVPTNI
ncbi:hypothetical protein B484DRAFT_252798 [Ochromonadaceae sp. CCMP2298]|nr:hypothetical protein B484DRAFT_252798 [Ochromonadaceae sp. CCMP2298]